MRKRNTVPKGPTLGSRIKEVRLSWNWSQDALALALCVDQASISLWERDRIPLKGSALVAMSALFGCPVHALKNGTDWVPPVAPSKLPAFSHFVPMDPTDGSMGNP